MPSSLWFIWLNDIVTKMRLLISPLYATSETLSHACLWFYFWISPWTQNPQEALRANSMDSKSTISSKHYCLFMIIDSWTILKGISSSHKDIQTPTSGTSSLEFTRLDMKTTNRELFWILVPWLENKTLTPHRSKTCCRLPLIPSF